jgi:hypothetical protein
MNKLVLSSVGTNFHSTLSTPDNLVLTSETQVYQDSPEIHTIHTLCTFSIHIKLHWHTRKTRGQKKNNNKK